MPEDPQPGDPEPEDPAPEDPEPEDPEPEDPEPGSEIAFALLEAVNAVRTAGTTCDGQAMPPVPRLVLDARLQRAAQAHSEDMAANGFMGHVGSDGSTLRERVNRENYPWSALGENVAWGYPNVAAVMVGWLGSAGHCRNIMSSNFTEFGAAEVGHYWTQVFARPR